MKKIIDKDTALKILRILNINESNDNVNLYYIEIKPYRLRSVGWKSQNHHYYSHIRSIALSVGESMHAVHEYVKERAVEMGYPYRIAAWGQITAKSESEATVQEASILIEASHIVAHELNIKLIESDDEEDNIIL